MYFETDFPAPPMFKKEFDEMCEKHKPYDKAILVNFSNKRMMPKELWDLRYDLYHYTDPDDDHYSQRSIYQFHYHMNLGGNELVPKRKICGLEWNFFYRSAAYGDSCHDYKHNVYEDMCYPQWDLENKYFDYEMFCASTFLPKPDNIERFKEMYSKIKSVEADPAQWVEALMEAKDHEFVCHSVEFRLGGNLDNKVLWLCYIDYLKIHDTQKLLQTYSKFIRFFLEDVGMLDEYREAVKKHGPVLVPWKNTQDFETYDEHFFEKEAGCQSYQRTLPVESPPTLLRFNADNAVTQYFPFLTNMMIYIRENASAKVLHKLYKACKYFHARFPKTLCYKVEVEDTNVPVTINNLSLKVSSEWLENTNVNNLFIANTFRCTAEDPLALSKIIPKIYQCNAKAIEIDNQHFSLDDVKLLNGHGNVMEISLSSPENTNGSCLNLEDILQLTPNIKRIYFWNGIQCTSNTAKKLCEMEFKNKINDIWFYNLKNDLLDPHDFAKFIKKNCSPDAATRIRIRFDFNGKEAFVKNFNEILTAALGNDFKKNDYCVQ